MRRRFLLAAAAATAAVGALAAAARALDAPSTVERAAIGQGERLAFVLAGDYGSREEAERANTEITFGEMQGFYVVPSASIEGLETGRWVLATAFRTARGAEEFEEMARMGGVATTRVVARYLGSAFVGLGQEPAPDGTGPLIEPLPAGDPARLE